MQPSQPLRLHAQQRVHHLRQRRRRRAAPQQLQAQLRSEGGHIHPVRQQAKAFAPATVANLGVGFDWLGCAVEVRLQEASKAQASTQTRISDDRCSLQALLHANLGLGQRRC